MESEIRKIVLELKENPFGDTEKFVKRFVKIFDTYSAPESLEVRKANFRKELIAITTQDGDGKTFVEPYTKENVKKFWNHWTEISPNGRKYRFEKEATFDMKRRLATWVSRSKTYSIVGLLQSKKLNK